MTSNSGRDHVGTSPVTASAFRPFISLGSSCDPICVTARLCLNRMPEGWKPRMNRKRSFKNLRNPEPANGFEPLTCAFRVRLREIFRNPRSLLRLRIRKISRLLRLRRIPETPDDGKCAPRVPQEETTCEPQTVRQAAF